MEVTHDDRPSIRVYDLVSARAELGRLAPRGRRVAWVEFALLERHLGGLLQACVC